MNMEEHIRSDRLKLVRRLPKDLIEDLPVLLVNRLGASEKAYMCTHDFIGHVEPDQIYRLGGEGFQPVDGPSPMRLPDATEVARLELRGSWIRGNESSLDSGANILGGNGKYILPEHQNDVVIPVAEPSPSNLACYGCRLIKIGSTVQFPSTGNLPVTVTSIGEDYVEKYLMCPRLGGGAYFEIHDRPHFHMSLSQEAGGYLIIGKRLDNGKCIVSAFRPPYGFGILMAPWTLHSDAHLIGLYMVVYSATREFSTVILTTYNGQLAKIRFEESNV